MPGQMTKPETIDAYLAGVRLDQRPALEKLRQTIRVTVPSAEECISYGLPAFRLNGRPLVAFGAWANHCAFYPMSSTAVKVFREQLKSFATSKGTIRFTSDKPLPTSLVKKLVKARAVENAGTFRQPTIPGKAVRARAKLARALASSSEATPRGIGKDAFRALSKRAEARASSSN